MRSGFCAGLQVTPALARRDLTDGSRVPSPLAVLVAELGLLELAGRRARDRFDELERIGQPELGEARGEERAELVGGGGLAFLEDNGGERTFGPLRMRDT